MDTKGDAAAPLMSEAAKEASRKRIEGHKASWAAKRAARRAELEAERQANYSSPSDEDQQEDVTSRLRAQVLAGEVISSDRFQTDEPTWCEALCGCLFKKKQPVFSEQDLAETPGVYIPPDARTDEQRQADLEVAFELAIIHVEQREKQQTQTTQSYIGGQALTSQRGLTFLGSNGATQIETQFLQMLTNPHNTFPEKMRVIMSYLREKGSLYSQSPSVDNDRINYFLIVLHRFFRNDFLDILSQHYNVRPFRSEETGDYIFFVRVADSADQAFQQGLTIPKPTGGSKDQLAQGLSVWTKVPAVTEVEQVDAGFFVLRFPMNHPFLLTHGVEAHQVNVLMAASVAEQDWRVPAECIYGHVTTSGRLTQNQNFNVNTGLLSTLTAYQSLVERAIHDQLEENNPLQTVLGARQGIVAMQPR